MPTTLCSQSYLKAHVTSRCAVHAEASVSLSDRLVWVLEGARRGRVQEIEAKWLTDGGGFPVKPIAVRCVCRSIWCLIFPVYQIRWTAWCTYCNITLPMARWRATPRWTTRGTRDSCVSKCRRPETSQQPGVLVFISFPYFQLGTEGMSVALLLWWPVCLLTRLASRLIVGKHTLTHTQRFKHTWHILPACWQSRQCFPCYFVFFCLAVFLSHYLSHTHKHTCKHKWTISDQIVPKDMARRFLFFYGIWWQSSLWFPPRYKNRRHGLVTHTRTKIQKQYHLCNFCIPSQLVEDGCSQVDVTDPQTITRPLSFCLCREEGCVSLWPAFSCHWL